MTRYAVNKQQGAKVVRKLLKKNRGKKMTFTEIATALNIPMKDKISRTHLQSTLRQLTQTTQKKPIRRKKVSAVVKVSAMLKTPPNDTFAFTRSMKCYVYWYPKKKIKIVRD